MTNFWGFGIVAINHSIALVIMIDIFITNFRDVKQFLPDENEKKVDMRNVLKFIGKK